MHLLETIKIDKFSLAKLLTKNSLLGPFSFGFVVFVFSLLTVGISFLNPCLFTPCLPFIVAIGAFACLRYKFKGLVGCLIFLSALYLIISPDIEKTGRLWQVCMLLAYSLDFFLILLVRFEMDSYLQEKTKEVHVIKLELQDHTLNFKEKEKSLNDKIRGFEESIRKLTEEAKDRILEKEGLLRNIELVRSEIEMLNLQKDQFISDAKLAKKRLEEAHALSKESVLLAQEKMLSFQMKKISQETSQIQDLESRILELQQTSDEKTKTSGFHIKVLEEETLKLRKELENKTGALTALEKAYLQETAQFKELESEFLKQIEEKEAQIANLEKVASNEKERLKELESAYSKALTISPNDEPQVKKLEGQYLQLKTQFDEKARVLSQTRKNLFQRELHIETDEIAKKERALEIEGEEAIWVQKNISLSNEEELEKEIISLEELVSHILRQ